MSRESFDCLKRARDICVKTIISSPNYGLQVYPALRFTFLVENEHKKGRDKPSGEWLEISVMVNKHVSNPCLLLFFVQAMCGLLQCGAVFDPHGLITRGYLYNWLQTVLNSPKEKVRFRQSGGRHLLNTRVSLLRQYCASHCITLPWLFSSDPSAGSRYTCTSFGEQRQHPVPTPLGNRQVLYGCEAGGQWLFQSTGFCFYEEVTSLFNCFYVQ